MEVDIRALDMLPSVNESQLFPCLLTNLTTTCGDATRCQGTCCMTGV